MDIELERRDEIAVRVHVRLSTLLVAVARLAPEQLEWSFEVEAGAAGAKGKLWLDLGAPRYFSTVNGSLQYTASGTWNSYRGLLWHWEATGMPPGRPMWVEAFESSREIESRTGLRGDSVDTESTQQRSGERWRTETVGRRVRLGEDAATPPARGSEPSREGA